MNLTSKEQLNYGCDIFVGHVDLRLNGSSESESRKKFYPQSILYLYVRIQITQRIKDSRKPQSKRTMKQ